MSKKKGADGKDEEKIVLEYMETQNRPFSVQNIVDALQKENIKKAAVERALASCLAAETVVAKEYGKAKVYMCSQSGIELPSPEEMAEMDANISTLGARLKELDAEAQEIMALNQALKVELTEEQAAEKVAENEKLIAIMQEKLEKLGDGSNLISREEMEKIELKLFKAKAEWKKRKRLANDVVDQISEGMNKKPKLLAQEIGLELDEEIGVSIDNLPAASDPTKKRKPLGRPPLPVIARAL